jgi:hypothetical protein
MRRRAFTNTVAAPAASTAAAIASDKATKGLFSVMMSSKGLIRDPFNPDHDFSIPVRTSLRILQTGR